MVRIAITTGDTKGIGKEITIKALKELNLPYEKVLIIGENIGLPYETIEIDSSDNGKFCYESLKLAASYASKGVVNAIVTAPVSKEALNKSGYHYSGQTEILEELLSSNGQKAEMMFIADDMRVMLLTRHLPLKDIVLSKNLIIDKVKRSYEFLVNKCNIKNPSIALCALNPHAGENGILGTEENEIITPSIEELQKDGINVSGPYSADGLFAQVGADYLNDKKQKYDCIIAMYHDQGLCPVKAIAFKKTVNTTIGLSVIRTSPSSGTAYDIAGKGKADAAGMIEAIKLAFKLS